MSFQSRRELLAQVGPRYREASSKEKTIILDEFVAATGYARKYAIRLLHEQPAPAVTGKIKRPRERYYGKPTQEALAVAWTAANCICAKRLVPFLPELVRSLEDHGHLTLTAAVRAQLLAISPATADRILSGLRHRDRPRGMTTTKAGPLLKHQIPVRTFADWHETEPGFFEADCVAHCGTSVAGMFLWSLVLTDVATGWTECLALRHRSQSAVINALGRVRQLLPFPLLGFDTDNGGEFINHAVLAYCDREEITFTRGRAHKKNDQCFVEQKNGSIVRQLVGYGRYEGEVAYRQLAELYRATRLYVNFFQPSMKLVSKHRAGSKVQRRYDPAQTPFQRLAAAKILAEERTEHLTQVFRALDPVRLLRQIQTLQDALWRHTVQESPSVGAATSQHTPSQHMGFSLAASMPAGGAMANAAQDILAGPINEASGAVRKRKYRRVRKQRRPRTWRTRKDPFEAVIAELHQWFLDAPDRTARSLLQEIQERYPGQYPDNSLRTLQRRVRTWRSQVIMEFDDRLAGEDASLTFSLPTRLRATLTASPSTPSQTGSEN
ncbi:MAG: DDE-type integrase/transposase/recombinase [Deltaproteobacteria bacterium]|nr:DDE-type integrase/transposase/recombinase [Deltaproteobacteria bacterium]